MVSRLDSAIAPLTSVVLLAVLAWSCRGEPPAPAQPIPARPSAEAPAPQRSNVLLVTIDSLRADHLGFYGYARNTTPNIDRLAAGGALFEVGIAQAPWTLPSLASLHTSQMPAEVGAIHNDGRLADFAVTAAELFRDAGYATAAFTAGAYTEPSRGFDQGFDVYENLDNKHDAADLNRLALAWLDRSGKRPFFLWVHYFDVHADYAAPTPWNGLFDGTPPAPEVARIGHLMRVVNGNEALGQGDLDRIKTSYDREIAYTDAMLGELWKGLGQRGLTAGTALAVGADHGEGFMEHGLLLHTLSVYDEFVRVPLVLRLPGRVPAGRRVAAQVRNLDVLPTLLDLARIPPPPGARGTSLLPLLRGEKGAEPGPAPMHTDTSSHEQHYAKMGEVRPDLFDTFFAVRTGAAKLVYSVKQDRYRLFDLRSDPGERSDAFPQKGAAYPELRRALDELRAYGPPSGKGALPVADPTPRELEQLRELGYIR
jgi:arylsulfatase A-like enzyme